MLFAERAVSCGVQVQVSERARDPHRTPPPSLARCMRRPQPPIHVVTEGRPGPGPGPGFGLGLGEGCMRTDQPPVVLRHRSNRRGNQSPLADELNARAIPAPDTWRPVPCFSRGRRRRAMAGPGTAYGWSGRELAIERVAPREERERERERHRHRHMGPSRITRLAGKLRSWLALSHVTCPRPRLLPGPPPGLSCSSVVFPAPARARLLHLFSFASSLFVIIPASACTCHWSSSHILHHSRSVAKQPIDPKGQSCAACKPAKLTRPAATCATHQG